MTKRTRQLVDVLAEVMSTPATTPLERNATGAAVGGWRDAGLCQETDPELFFPERGGTAAPALRVCAACEVRVECLAYALDHRERFGVWGGMTERQRRRLLRQRLSAAARALAVVQPVDPEAEPAVVEPDAAALPAGEVA